MTHKAYAEAVADPLCRCGNVKKPHEPFCSRCYGHLPATIRYPAYKAHGYDGAIAHFEKIEKRKSWRTFSIMQPWCYATIKGLRHYDTRSYQVPYRGPCAIASMKAMPDLNAMPEWFQELLNDNGIVKDGAYAPVIVTGMVLAVGNLVDIIEAHKVPDEKRDLWGRYDRGRYAWRFENIREIEPVESDLKSVSGWVKLKEKRV